MPSLRPAHGTPPRGFDMDIRAEIADMITACYAGRQKRIALLAAHGNCTQRNVQNWLGLSHQPRLLQFYGLVQHNPEFYRMVLDFQERLVDIK